MVEFGLQLQKSIAKGKPEWSSYYIDYNRLKALLKQSKQDKRKQKSQSFSGGIIALEAPMGSPRGNNNRQNSKSLTDTSNQIISSQFQHALDQEIEKVVLFLLHQQGSLAHDLSFLNEKRTACQQQVHSARRLFGNQKPLLASPLLTSNYEETLDATVEDCKLVLSKLADDYRSNANLVLDFISFVELNVTAVRKILKKHDKVFPHNKKLSQEYIEMFTSQVDSHLDQLYNYGGLSALMVTLQKAFGELHGMEIALLELQFDVDISDRSTSAQKAITAHRRVQSDSVMMAILEESTVPTTPEKAGMFQSFRRRSARSTVDTQQNMLVALCTVTSPSEPILQKIHLARNRLKQSTTYVEVVAAQSLMMFEQEDAAEEDLSATPKVMTRSQQMSSFLNLCSTFLYMTNYYIVAPTSGQYADKLGSTEAMAGIIIGMTPNAALVATVLYGWWSNHSYKSALIFASSCSLIGNVFYALALSRHSLTYVMIGRFFNGFGSARSINRRFIADTFSRSERTAASASFVVAGGLGMAVGPAIAAILGKVHYPEDSLYFTVETSPGWVMLTLWSVFFILFVCFFEEPDRSELYKESTTKKSSTPTGTPNSERHPLLKKADSAASKTVKKKEPPIYKNVAVMLTLFLYFVLKFALECLLSSSATVTSYYFHWNTEHTGTFLAFLGLLNFPANMFVARLSHHYQDRDLIYGTLYIMLLSILGIFVYDAKYYTSYQYMVCAILIFLSANCLEGPNMSLLSKVIPKSWAKGIFNSGFLATEAGTAARSIGDILISAMATWMGFENLLNATFLPLLISTVVAIALVRVHFDAMVERDEDDEEEEEEDATNSNREVDVEKYVKLK